MDDGYNMCLEQFGVGWVVGGYVCVIVSSSVLSFSVGFLLVWDGWVGYGFGCCWWWMVFCGWEVCWVVGLVVLCCWGLAGFVVCGVGGFVVYAEVLWRGYV